MIAIAFKFGAVPFHMWVPDVYSGAPTGVTLFLSTVPKIASFAFAFRLLAHGLGGIGSAWQDMLAPLAVLSMVFGNIIAIAQTNLKRLLAYSAIGNVGFILLGFVAGSAEGYQAALYYTIAYVIMTLGFLRRTHAGKQRRFRSRRTLTSSRDCTSAIHCWRWS